MAFIRQRFTKYDIPGLKALGSRCVTDAHCCSKIIEYSCPGRPTLRLPDTIFMTVSGLAGAFTLPKFPNYALTGPGPTDYEIYGTALQNTTYELRLVNYSPAVLANACGLGPQYILSNATVTPGDPFFTVNAPVVFQQTNTVTFPGAPGPTSVDIYLGIAICISCTDFDPVCAASGIALFPTIQSWWDITGAPAINFPGGGTVPADACAVGPAGHAACLIPPNPFPTVLDWDTIGACGDVEFEFDA